MSIYVGRKGERSAFMVLRLQEREADVKAGARMPQQHSWQVQFHLQSSRNILCSRKTLEIRNSICEEDILGSFAVCMARTRERQPCRRGPGRGAPSRPPAVAEEHHHCCCSYCFRRFGIPQLQVSQYMDTSIPNEEPPRQPMLPAFGTAVFKLGNLSAHVSILFVRDAEEDLEGARNSESPSANPLDRAEDQAVAAKGKAPIQVASASKAGASSSNAEANEVQEDPLEGFGYPIVEMDPGDLEPEE